MHVCGHTRSGRQVTSTSSCSLRGTLFGPDILGLVLHCRWRCSRKRMPLILTRYSCSAPVRDPLSHQNQRRVDQRHRERESFVPAWVPTILRHTRAARPSRRALAGLATRRTRSYTFGMKTAVSLPDDVFREAERQARRTRKSRSQLYAEALSEYLARHAPDEVTEAMNSVVAQLKEPIDPFVSAAARRVLERSEW